MAGPLSQQPRQLGSESGKLRRLARDVRRGGGNPTALLNAAAEKKFGERGITSSEENIASGLAEQAIQRDTLRSQYGALRGARPVSGAPSPAPAGTGTSNDMTTDAGTGAAPASPASPAAPASPASPFMRSTKAQAPEGVFAPAPVGKIGGEVASDVIGKMQGEAEKRSFTSSEGVTFGSDVGKRNLETMGAVGAAEDYFKRKKTIADKEAERAKEKYGIIAGQTSRDNFMNAVDSGEMAKGVAFDLLENPVRDARVNAAFKENKYEGLSEVDFEKAERKPAGSLLRSPLKGLRGSRNTGLGR